MANGTLRRAAGCVAAAANDGTCGYFASDIAGTREIRRGIATAAVLIAGAKLTDDATTAGGLADGGSRWPIGCAEATAAGATIGTEGAFDPRAVGRH